MHSSSAYVAPAWLCVIATCWCVVTRQGCSPAPARGRVKSPKQSLGLTCVVAGATSYVNLLWGGSMPFMMRSRVVCHRTSTCTCVLGSAAGARSLNLQQLPIVSPGHVCQRALKCRDRKVIADGSPPRLPTPPAGRVTQVALVSVDVDCSSVCLRRASGESQCFWWDCPVKGSAAKSWLVVCVCSRRMSGRSARLRANQWPKGQRETVQ